MEIDMVADRSIHLNSIRNARELGGYVTCDGRRIKNGVLLRTACLNGISDEDMRLLTDVYRLEHIIDFRMPMELLSAEDPAIAGAEYHHLDVFDQSAFSAQDAPDTDIKSLDLLRMVEKSERSGMLDDGMYIGFLMRDAGKAAYSAFFRILLSADPDRAVLWHCTSGKDRTGLAAMLLLSALGADEDTVVGDYLLTNEFNAQEIAATRQYLKARGCDDALIRKAVIVAAAVDERFMRSALAWMRDEYGSAVGYIRDGLSITQDEIDSLKDRYLI